MMLHSVYCCHCLEEACNVIVVQIQLHEFCHNRLAPNAQQARSSHCNKFNPVLLTRHVTQGTGLTLKAKAKI